MSRWYYSDPQRNRLGPVSDDDLSQLHAHGQLPPGTLVWREGMSDWRAWSDVMHEVVGIAPTPQPVRFATPAMEPALAAQAGYNPYEVVERPLASPYSPPAAAVTAYARAVHEGDVVYARFLKRVASNAVDGLLALLMVYALLIPLLLAMGAGLSSVTRGAGAMAAGLGVGVIVLVYAIQFCIPATYQGAMLSSGWRATLGKRLTGTKVVRSDGSPIGFWRGFLRNVFFAVTSAMCGLGAIASAIMTVALDRRQGLHDLVCDTVVVDEHAFTGRPELQDESLNTATKIVLGIYLLLIIGVLTAFFMMGVFAARGS
ncbi:RDD family protein [Lysobacter claricitrinus]|uniref:RDD family protein n=1 Tax=Lysobacter claricitrinus TaxID=3367728 RepID=UPI0037DAE286